MRQGQGSKRSRGRGGGRRNAPQRHQNFDSNGPSIRIRGNANQVYEKYLQLARDANTAGDRVAAENMFQHAEHYFRVLNAEERESQQAQARLQNRNDGEDGYTAQPSQSNRGNGAEHRPSQRHSGNDAPPRMENSGGSDIAPGATGEQPVRQRDDAGLSGGDPASEDSTAPRRPQRRSRRSNGPPAPPNPETVDGETSENRAPTADTTQTPAVEREQAATPPEKQAAD
jgi:hypothetical protein